MKKRSNLSRLLAYAGGHRKLTVLGCVLSGAAAVLGLVPYVCVWLVARQALAVFPAVTEAEGLARWGWMAVWFAVANIAALLRRPDVHPHRRLPDRPEHALCRQWPI